MMKLMEFWKSTHRKLSEAQIFLQSKRLKGCSTTSTIEQPSLKKYLEKPGRKLRLKFYDCNGNKILYHIPFKHKF